MGTYSYNTTNTHTGIFEFRHRTVRLDNGSIFANTCICFIQQSDDSTVFHVVSLLATVVFRSHYLEFQTNDVRANVLGNFNHFLVVIGIYT